MRSLIVKENGCAKTHLLDTVLVVFAGTEGYNLPEFYNKSRVSPDFFFNNQSRSVLFAAKRQVTPSPFILFT